MPKAAKPAAPNAASGLTTRARILTEAMRLFADHGYAGTTITQIESAAGLSPGSGALYRHFRSKQEILIAGFTHARARLEANRAAADVALTHADLPRNDEELANQLRVTFALVHTGLEATRDMVLAQMKGGSSLPREVREAMDSWLSESLSITARNMGERQRLSGVTVDGLDLIAEAYVLMAPLIWAKVIEWNHGSLPGGLSAERIRDAWVRHWVALSGEEGARSALAPRSGTKRKKSEERRR